MYTYNYANFLDNLIFSIRLPCGQLENSLKLSPVYICDELGSIVGIIALYYCSSCLVKFNIITYKC